MRETDPTVAAKASTKTRKAAAKRKAPVRPGSKTAKILDLLKQPTGASLKEIMKATGWQKHSVRGFLSGTIKKKMSLRLKSVERNNGEWAYRIAS